MRKRIEYLEELELSMCIGGGITLVMLAAVHKIFSAGEMIAFWLGMKASMTYAAWSVITIIKERIRKHHVDIDG